MHKSPQETQIEVREEEEEEEEEGEEEGEEEKSIRRNMKGLPVRQALKNGTLVAKSVENSSPLWNFLCYCHF